MGLTAKNGREMPDYRKPVAITDKLGRQTTVWRGKKQKDKSGAGKSKRGLDRDNRVSAATPKKGPTLRGRFWGRVKGGYADVQAIREHDREQRLLTDKPAEMSDWNLYKARDLCRSKRKFVEQGIKIVQASGDKQLEREATRALAILDIREDAVVTEIKTRRGPITRLYRRANGRDWRTGKRGRRGGSRRRRGSSVSSTASRASSSADAFVDRGLDKTGEVLQSPFDLIWDFIENVATSTKLRVESLKFW